MSWEDVQYDPEQVQIGAASEYSRVINDNNEQLVDVVEATIQNIKLLPQTVVSSGNPLRVDGTELQAGDIFFQKYI